MIERRRRERINDSLNQLKALILEAMHKDESRYSKMEKADILQMTVSHLRELQQRQVALQRGSDVMGRYVAGFAECAQEVGHYLQSVDDLNPDVQGRLMSHLASRIGTTTSVTSPAHQTAVPTATAVTSLPGMRVLSPAAAASEGHTSVTGVMSLALSAQGVPVLVSPAGLAMLPAQSPPRQDTSSLGASGAIPLYVTSPRSDVISPGATSTPSSSPSPPHVMSPANSYEEADAPTHHLNIVMKRETISPSLPIHHVLPVGDVGPSNTMEPVWRPW